MKLNCFVHFGLIPVKEEDVDYIDNNDEGMVYRVVDLNEHRKMNAMASGDASLPANCQYVLINSANGYIQALATPTTTDGIEDSDLHVDRPRSSVTIKPKSVHIDVDVEARLAAATVSNLNDETSEDDKKAIYGHIFCSVSRQMLKQPSIRLRPTSRSVTTGGVPHTMKLNVRTLTIMHFGFVAETEICNFSQICTGRRRDKINHWIMKLGSIIPADGTSLEVGDDEPVSVAAVEGQSKGNILSRACEYVQTLQERLSRQDIMTQYCCFEFSIMTLSLLHVFQCERRRADGKRCGRE